MPYFHKNISDTSTLGISQNKFFQMVDNFFIEEFNKYSINYYYLKNEIKSGFNPNEHVYAGLSLYQHIEGEDVTNDSPKQFKITRAALEKDHVFLQSLVAHELGHLVNGHNLTASLDNRNIKDEVEADNNVEKLYGNKALVNFLEELLKSSWNPNDKEIIKRIGTAKKRQKS